MLTKCLQNLNFLCVFSEIYFVLLEFLALRMNGNFDGLADQRAAVPALHFTISRSHHICQRMSHNPCPIKCIILQLFGQRLFVPFFLLEGVQRKFQYMMLLFDYMIGEVYCKNRSHPANILFIRRISAIRITKSGPLCIPSLL